MILRLLQPLAVPLAVAATIAALCGYIYWQSTRVGHLQTEVENLEQSIEIKEEVHEVRTRPVPAAVGDILDRM